jgi:hypothetical protein
LLQERASMATGSVEYVRVTRVVDHPIGQVWAVAGRFGGLEHWADGVTACDVAGEGVGAVRTVTRNGGTVRERLDRLDPDAYEIAYAILPPHPLPAADVRGTIELKAAGADRTELVWRSHASDFQVPPEALGARIELFYAASIEGLARLLSAA